MLESLITSKTRIKLLLRFFLNSDTSAHLRGLESEFGESTNGIRLELNRFEQAGLLCSHNEGNRKVYTANTQHPLFVDIQRLVRKHVGIDSLIENVVVKIGNIEKVFLTGAFANGQDSRKIELLITGSPIDVDYLDLLIRKAMQTVNRDIRYRLLDTNEKLNEQADEAAGSKMLLIWQREN